MLFLIAEYKKFSQSFLNVLHVFWSSLKYIKTGILYTDFLTLKYVHYISEYEQNKPKGNLIKSATMSCVWRCVSFLSWFPSLPTECA